jgi:hypothetical protein
MSHDVLMVLLGAGLGLVVDVLSHFIITHLDRKNPPRD